MIHVEPDLEMGFGSSFVIRSPVNAEEKYSEKSNYWVTKAVDVCTAIHSRTGSFWSSNEDQNK